MRPPPFAQYGACEHEPENYALKQIYGDFGEGIFRFSLSTAPTHGNMSGPFAMKWLRDHLAGKYEYLDCFDDYHDTCVEIVGAKEATLFKLFCL